MGNGIRNVSCLCGAVELETAGAPIVGAACHCEDCHEGSRKLEALTGAPPILDSYGGTHHLLYRRDRVTFTKGKELLKRVRVREDSPDRAFASCCNSYLFLDLDPNMHWVPIHRNRFKGADVPAIEMRINAKFKSGAENAPNDVPCFSSFPPRFMARLLTSKLAMIFGR